MSLAQSSAHTGSGRVLTVLYKEHAADAFRYALHLTGRRADAEDIVQQVFLQAHRHLESGRELLSPRAWLLTAVKHRAFNLTRDRHEVPVDRPVMPVEPRESSIDEAAQLAEVRGMLWTLPEAQHHAFVLRHWSGLSQREIADVLETTPSAVESLLGRARSTLLRAHETASDACSQVRHRLLDSTEPPRADVAHLGACRPCRQAYDRLARAANVAGTLALVPGAHVAHAIAGLVPGFSAHAATSTAAAVGTASGAGAGAGVGGTTATLGTTTAVTTVGKVAVAAKAMAAVVAATAVVGTLPAANRMVSGLAAGQSAPKSSAARHAARHPTRQAPAAAGAVGNGPPAAVIEEHGPNGHAPAQNPGKHAGAGQGIGKPANPGGGKHAGVGGGPGKANGLGAGGNGKAAGKHPGVGGGKPTGAGGGNRNAGGNGNANAGGNGDAGGSGNGNAGGNGDAGGNAGGNGNGGGKPAAAGKP